MIVFRSGSRENLGYAGKILSQATKSNKFDTAEFEKFIDDENFQAALVPVKLVTSTKGVPERLARIYVVSDSLKEYEVLVDELKHSSPVPESRCEKECYDVSNMDAIGDNQFPIVGFVTSGDRNLTGKTATAMGYVSLSGLLKVMTHPEMRGSFAFRNQDVFGYHRATLQVLA